MTSSHFILPGIDPVIAKGSAHGDRRRTALLPAMFVVVLLTAGCAQASDGPVMSKPSSPALPAGAIATGDDVYMVPVAPDADGCMQYRMYSPTKMVVQVMFYKDAKGGFTANRDPADCSKPR